MKGKKVLSVLLASVMMFTAVPVGSIGAMAAPVQNAQVQEQKVKTQAESGLSNIAADCEISVPSEEGANVKENMVDGNPSSLWVNNGANWPCTVTFALPKAKHEMCEKNSAEIRIRPYTVEHGCIPEICTEQRNK